MQTDKTVIIQRIQSLCEKMNIAYPLPLGEDAVLSGSFMWHVLTADEKTSWTPCDVDVFCTLDAVPRFREYLYKNGYKLMFMKTFAYVVPEKANIIEEWVPSSEPDWVDDRYNRKEDVKFFQDFCAENKTPPIPENCPMAKRRDCSTRQMEKNGCLQLIISRLPVQKACEIIVDKFDLPTLENYFDGEKTVVTYPENVIARLTDVRDKQYVGPYRLDTRIEKYKTYGLNVRVKTDKPKVPVLPKWFTKFPSAEEAYRIMDTTKNFWTPDSPSKPTLEDCKRNVREIILNHISKPGNKMHSTLRIVTRLADDMRDWLENDSGTGYTMINQGLGGQIGGEPATSFIISWQRPHGKKL